MAYKDYKVYKTKREWLSEYGAYVPIISSYIRIPRDHASAEKSWPLLRIISGATNSGVPQNVHVLRSNPIFFAKPKSVYRKGKVCLQA